MATATVTEAEILEAIEARGLAADAGAVVYEFTSHVEALWSDLRPSEHARIESLLSDVYELADDFEARVAAAVLAAALTFAHEYPDAPRPRAASLRLVSVA